jgi:hypothetical protein
LVYNEYRTVSDFILAGIPMDFSHNFESLPMLTDGQPMDYTFVMEPIKKLATQKALDELIQWADFQTEI